ncbi:DUF4157 domain-containing protein [Nodosilinea sp. FACHB-131]|nr:DUF4157 domain-containing protein [Nodosilinea sp. FACHB-131]
MKQTLQRQSIAAVTNGIETLVSAGLEFAIQRTKGRGQPLEERVRLPMEKTFGADFSQVRLHTDATSDAINQQLRSHAFTNRHDIFWRQGEYNPDS